MENHEESWPLIAFTTLGPLSIGGILGLLLVDPAYRAGWGSSLFVVFAIGVLALAASLLHLGHPFRAVRAIANLSGSWLSREVMLFGLFLACALCAAVFAASDLGAAFAVGAVVFGAASLLVTGKVYHLRARPSWDHWTTLVSFLVSAFAAGVPVGMFLFALSAPSRTPLDAVVGNASAVALGGLVVALVLTGLRLGRLRGGGQEEQASWRLATGSYVWALAVRVVGVALAFALLLTGGPGIAFAWAAAALGEFGERALFFNAVVPVSLPAREGVPRRGHSSKIVGAA